MPTCPGVDFSVSIPLTSNKLPKEANIVVRKKGDKSSILVLFDDLSIVLHKSPLTIEYPNPSKKEVSVGMLLTWIRTTYLELMKVTSLGWYHDPNNCMINNIVVLRDGKFAIGFST